MGAVMRLQAVNCSMPDPPYPKATKANGYRPEVDWQRIRGSKTWRLCAPDMRNNLLRLWLESWNEVPAGSWENDDEIIASAIDMPARLFAAHRDQLMRGWVLHSDGRLYHATVTEMVLAMLSKRRSSAERVAKHREKKQEVADNVTRYQHVSNAQEQETGTGTGTGEEAKASLSASATAGGDRAAPACPHLDLIALYHELLPELPKIVPSRWGGSADAKALGARWKEDGRHQRMDFWRAFFGAVRANPHWMGANDRGWQANLRWLVQRANFDKVLEKMVNARANRG